MGMVTVSEGTEKVFKIIHYWCTRASWRRWPHDNLTGAAQFRRMMRMHFHDWVDPGCSNADVVSLLLDFADWMQVSETRNMWRGMKTNAVRAYFAEKCGAIYRADPHDGWPKRGGRVHPPEYVPPAGAIMASEFEAKPNIPKLKAKSGNVYDV